MNFNTIIKTLFDTNYIFYIIALVFIMLWVLYTIINTFYDISEQIYLVLNIKEETTEFILSITGTIGMVVLYFALCNTCYMEEYYSKNIKNIT